MYFKTVLALRQNREHKKVNCDSNGGNNNFLRCDNLAHAKRAIMPPALQLSKRGAFVTQETT